MKKIFFLLLLAVSFFEAEAQVPQKNNTWFQFKLIIVDSLGIPNDTVAIPASLKNRPWLGWKGDALYTWSPSQQKWIEQGIGGGFGGAWGSITGTLSDQSDLMTALGLKLNISDSLLYTTRWRHQHSIDSLAALIGGGGGGITADNGLNMSTSTNVQLGGTLNQLTIIQNDGNEFIITGAGGNTLKSTDGDFQTSFSGGITGSSILASRGTTGTFTEINATETGASMLAGQAGDYTTLYVKKRGIELDGAVYYRVSSAPDANYTILSSDYIIELAAPTTLRTLTLPNPAAHSGRALIIRNENTGTNWEFSSAVRLVNGTTITTIPAERQMHLYSNGTEWKMFH